MTHSEMAKETLLRIRQDVIDQIRHILNVRKQREIQFNTPLIWGDGDGNENEVLDGYKIAEYIDQKDEAHTALYGDVQQELTTDDLTTDQLIWVLEQIETEDYEVIEEIAAE